MQVEKKDDGLLTVRRKVHIRVHRKEIEHLSFGSVLGGEGGRRYGDSRRPLIIHHIVVVMCHEFEVF